MSMPRTSRRPSALTATAIKSPPPRRCARSGAPSGAWRRPRYRATRLRSAGSRRSIPARRFPRTAGSPGSSRSRSCPKPRPGRPPSGSRRLGYRLPGSPPSAPSPPAAAPKSPGRNCPCDIRINPPQGPAPPQPWAGDVHAYQTRIEPKDANRRRPNLGAERTASEALRERWVPLSGGRYSRTPARPLSR
jgi:hypothetical protein